MGDLTTWRPSNFLDSGLDSAASEGAVGRSRRISAARLGASAKLEECPPWDPRLEPARLSFTWKSAWPYSSSSRLCVDMKSRMRSSSRRSAEALGEDSG